MAAKDPRVDAYIAKSAEFARPILKHLRKLVHTGCPEVEETLKWSMPSFTYKGILCGMAAFKQHCTFGFWKHDLLIGKGTPVPDTKAEEAMGQFGRLTKVSDLPPDNVLLDLIRKAARLNEAGVKSPAKSRPKVRQELVVPDYFLAALSKNKKAQATFDDFSHSHRKEYVEWITEAKGEDTRKRRLDTTLQWLAEGKPRNWKYLNC